MDPGCTYFESEVWDERLERHVARVWDLETAARKIGTDNPQQWIETIAESLDADPGTLAKTPVGEVLEIDRGEQLDISMSVLTSVWCDEHSWLPSTCPHGVLDGFDRCCFHLPPAEYDEAGISPADVTRALTIALDHEDGRETCFIGAHLKTLDLAEEHIKRTGSRSIDFRLATIEKAIDCADATVGPPLNMLGAEICTEVEKTDTTTGESANRYISVDADIDFSGARFRDSVDCKQARFQSSVSFNDAVFDDVAMFNAAVFNDQLEMWATVDGKADFTRAVVKGTAQLRGTYETAAIFNYAYFERDVILYNSTINGKAEFLATEIKGTVDAGHTSFDGLVRFCETSFFDEVDFQSARFQDTVRFRRCQAPNDAVNLRGATLSSGRIEQDTPPVHFDLADATIGTVRIDTADGGSLSENPLAYLRIHRTDFEKFDFGRHSGLFKPDWKLDALAASWPESSLDSGVDLIRLYEQIEDTYLRAKSGATDAGHNKAASEFFVHEMRFRRKQHAAIVRTRISELREEAGTVPWPLYVPLIRVTRGIIDVARGTLPGPSSTQVDAKTSGWLAGYRWLSNGLLGTITGYGEKPQRPILGSVLVIGLFAGIYRLLGVVPPANGPFGLGYLLLSIQSFITFILGASPVDAGFWPQVVSALEGFTGAFLIAVFVFTLTRSIHR